MCTKNLLFLIDRIENGGAERALYRLAEEIEYNFDNVYICTNYKTTKKFPYGEIIDLNVVENASLLSKITNLLKFAIGVKKIKKERNITHTISFLERANIVNILTKVNGEKSLISVRNNLEIQYRKFNIVLRFLIRLVISFFYSRANIISLSENVKTELERYLLFSNNIKTIYNGYDFHDIERKANYETPNIFSNDHINFTFVGRLSFQKNILNLIKAFSLVKEENKNVRLWVFGEGELYNAATEIISSLNMDDYVKLVGVKENVFPYIYKADCFIFPSKFEGFGNALAEAIGLGKYVITANCKHGPKEMLASSIGDNEMEVTHSYIIYPSATNESDDIKNIKKAILVYLENKRKYSNVDFVSSFRNRFSIENMTKSWLDELDV